MSTRSLGYYGEKLAARYLTSRGYKILKTNYTISGGEIDIIARKYNPKSNSGLVFIEVKTRQSNYFGHGEDSVDFWKKHHLQKTIDCYLDKFFKFDPDYQVDIIEVTLDGKGGLKDLEHFEDVEM